MGLNCSHDAFDGAYSAFNRLRQAVCFVAGGSYPPHYTYKENGDLLKDHNDDPIMKTQFRGDWFYLSDKMDQLTHPGLWEFCSHSDCDGSISPGMCKKVADELEALLPAMRELKWVTGGHLDRYNGYAGSLERFIAGCRLAHRSRQSLKFR